MKKIITCIALLACASLTGCASIVNGTSQPVSVSTSPVQGAACTLKNKVILQSAMAHSWHTSRQILAIHSES